MKIIKHGSKYSEDKNSNFSLEAKFESMIKIAKKIINQNKNNTGDCSIETALAYDVANYLPKVLKENEELKEEKEQAWEEWNNLEQGSYETEQKIKQQIKKLQEENEKLIYARNWYFEHTVNKICTPEMLDKILRNDYISKQKLKDKIRKNEEIIDISNDGDLIHELLQKNKVYEKLLESEE